MGNAMARVFAVRLVCIVMMAAVTLAGVIVDEIDDGIPPKGSPEGSPRPDEPQNPPTKPGSDEPPNGSAPPRRNNGKDISKDDDDDDENRGFDERVGRPALGILDAVSRGPIQLESQIRPERVSNKLRDTVRSGDFNRVADLLSSSSNVPGLARGFRFSPEDRGQYLARSPERLRDGDVVTMKGIAKSALDTGQSLKLARVMARAIFPFQPFSRAQLALAMIPIISNRALMAEVIRADASFELLLPSGRRKLMCDSCTPVNSWVCASCWAKDVCSPMFWCD